MAVNVFFLRVSSSHQQLESQFDEVWNYFSKQVNLERESIKVIEYKESGVKLSEEERLGFTDLKELVDTVGVNCIYVSELSRVARTEKVLWSIVDYLARHKIQLKCKNPEFSLLNEDRTEIPFNSRLMISTFGTLATQEAIEKKQRFARGKARKAKEGKFSGGAIPYGYRINKQNDNQIEIDEEGEAKIVREVFDMYERGYSQMQIAKELHERGIKGRAVRKTKYFTLSLVHQLLTNELLTGKTIKNKGSSYERRYPPIITEEQFQRCREIANKNNTNISKASRVYYAHGLIICTECNRRFTSTGNKGYYHCKDAYNYNKKYDGYDGKPMCTNRLCISTNIMDSLLWELATDYESTYILEDAKEKLKDAEENLRITQQKIDALPQQLDGVEKKRQRLLDAYAEGLNRDKYLEKKRLLEEEVKGLMAKKASYYEVINHYNSLIDEIKRSIEVNDSISDWDDVDNYIDKIEMIHQGVESISDDTERSRIIHKHFKSVIIEKTTINYSFRKYPDGKDVSAKRITITPYLGKPRIFLFVHNDGKGGTMLEELPSAGNSYAMPGGKKVTIPKYHPFQMKYLNRVVDEKKIIRRSEQVEKKKDNERKERTQIRNKGYISMPEMMNKTGLSYSTIHNLIKDDKIKGIKVGGVWFVKSEEYEAYFRIHPPKPKKHISGEKKLLDSLKIMNDLYF